MSTILLETMTNPTKIGSDWILVVLTRKQKGKQEKEKNWFCGKVRGINSYYFQSYPLHQDPDLCVKLEKLSEI